MPRPASTSAAPRPGRGAEPPPEIEIATGLARSATLSAEALAALAGRAEDREHLAAWLTGDNPATELPYGTWQFPDSLATIQSGGRFEVVGVLRSVGEAVLAHLLAVGDPIGPVLLTKARCTMELLCEPGTAAGLPTIRFLTVGEALRCPRPGLQARGRSWLSVPPPGTLTRPADLHRALTATATTSQPNGGPRCPSRRPEGFVAAAPTAAPRSSWTRSSTAPAQRPLQP